MKSVSRPAEVTLSLRPARSLPPFRPGDPHLSHAELLQRHAAHPRVRTHLLRFAGEHGLRLAHLDCARRIARLKGTSENLSAAFPAKRGHVAVPACLATDVEAVFGLGSKPRLRRKSLPRDPQRCSGRTLRDVAEAYSFPRGRDASGQTIGLLEFGGGFRRTDVQAFCRRNKVPLPEIVEVSIDGAANTPAPARALHELLDAVGGRAHPSAASLASERMQEALSTIEVTMDLEILAALAPGARLVIYFAPPDRQFHALHRAIYGRRHRPSVLSLSWSEPETAVPKNALHSINGLLEAAARLGITVCASTGDEGALNGAPDGVPNVNFPASSPFCLACGGTATSFVKRGGRTRVLREVVWNSSHFGIRGASGGGVSRIFPGPRWQRRANVPANPEGRRGRGIPDVAGVADPRFGCELLVAGRSFSSAGTSAVAPLWAALIARCNAALKRRCGHINEPLYRLAASGDSCLRPVVKGGNGFYTAHAGWNACTGYGTPRGTEILRALAAQKAG